MYKKIFFFIVLIIFSLSLAKSQSHMGLSGGINFSRLSGDDSRYEEKINRKGLYGGLTWDINVKKSRVFRNTIIQTGILYSQQGAIYKNNYFGVIDSASILNNTDSIYYPNANAEITEKFYRKVDYITVPLLWKQDWGGIYTKLGVYGQIGLLTDSVTNKIYRYPTQKIISNGTSGKFLEDAIFYDLGINTGLGYQVPISNEYDFFIDFSYKFGFMKVDKKTYNSSNIMRNSFFTISTGVIIFGKKSRYIKR